jgi:hypothetical protein
VAERPAADPFATPVVAARLEAAGRRADAVRVWAAIAEGDATRAEEPLSRLLSQPVRVPPAPRPEPPLPPSWQIEALPEPARSLWRWARSVREG